MGKQRMGNTEEEDVEEGQQDGEEEDKSDQIKTAWEEYRVPPCPTH